MKSSRSLRWFNIRVRGFALFLCFSLFLIIAALLNIGNPPIDAAKFAYVFHVRTPKDLCYALANSEQVFNLMPDLNVVLLMSYKVQLDKLVLPRRVHVHSTPDINDGYHEAFLRFEAFGMTAYERVIILNSNAVVTSKLNQLFFMDMQGHQVAAASANEPRPRLTLSTAVIVAQPSEKLYEAVSAYQNPTEVQTAGEEAGLVEREDSKTKTLYEDALLNKMFDDGKNVKVLPPYSENLGIGAREIEKYKEAMGAYCVIDSITVA